MLLIKRIFRAENLIFGVAVLFLGVLIHKLYLSMSFPWDLLMWSESPFMTNMLKITQGGRIFEAPALANSFAYPPTLEYICYFFLKPFNAHLDVRYCRLVVILMGLMASGVLTITMTCLATRINSQLRVSSYTIFTFLFSTLLIFENFTSDVLHPDNLQILHYALTFALCYCALASRNIALALVAVVVSCVGILTKQTALAYFPAIALAMILSGCWTRKQLVILVITGCILYLSAILYVVLSPNIFFWSFQVELGHGLDLSKVTLLISSFAAGRTFLLAFLTPICFVYAFRFSKEIFRPYLVTWVCMGLIGGIPHIGAFLKPMAAWNNLFVFDVWMYLLIWPVFGYVQKTKPPEFEKDDNHAFIRMVQVMVIALTLFTLFPAKESPSRFLYEYGQKLDGMIDQDVQNGKEILLAHGTMPLIRSGLKDVPLDRANSYLELSKSGKSGLAHTAKRIREGYYARIYLNSSWYGDEIEALIESHYDLVNEVPAVRGNPAIVKGYQGLMGTIRIFESKRS